MTMFKAWLTALEALKYSDSRLNRLSLFNQIIITVERRLNEETNFHAQFKRAEDKISHFNNETRWKISAERDASKVLWKNVVVHKTIAKKRRVKAPVTSRLATVTDTQRQVIASRPVSVVSKEHMLPVSYFAGRQDLFELSYQTGTVTTSAGQMVREGLSL